MSDEVFPEQKGRNLVAYVDDIVIKSDKKETHIKDLKETFKNLRTSGLKLNPDKCIFGIKKGKLLGCLVAARGIEANPNKNSSDSEHGTASNEKASTEAHGKNCGTKQVHSKISRKGAIIL
jgi:hypothetical protein